MFKDAVVTNHIKVEKRLSNLIKKKVNCVLDIPVILLLYLHICRS